MQTKTVLITGANRGIGLELARQYLEAGWFVIATCRKPEAAQDLQHLAQKYPALRIEALEVTDFGGLKGFAARLDGVALDVLVNCAGIISGFEGAGPDETQTFGSIEAGAWERVFRVNTIAPVMVTQALMPQLLAGKEKKVAMISSMMGSLARGQSGDIAYRTSKAALNMAMRTLVLPLSEQGIAISSYHPGWVKTDMGGPEADITVSQSAAGLRRQIEALTLKETGSFLGYDGAVWPW